MTSMPVTLCLYTSTKGHFGKDTYREIVESFLNQVPAQYLACLMAHIKWEPDDGAKQTEMAEWLMKRGFLVANSCQPWKHGDPSHNLGYCQDIRKMVSKIQTPYYFHLEDDFLLSSPSVTNQLAKALKTLDSIPSLLQVRFPRFINEKERIARLKAKHGIDAKVTEGFEGIYHSDWSNHPFVARTRDINAAIRFVFASNLPKHSESGLGVAMKILSDSETPFFTPHPDSIRVGHIGVATDAERDDLGKPLIAT